MRIISRTILLFALVVPISGSLAGQLPQAMVDRIDAMANKALADTGAPSASVAVVKDGKIAYVDRKSVV